MQVKDIITLEKDNHANVYLLREGMFWWAYEKAVVDFWCSDELEGARKL